MSPVDVLIKHSALYFYLPVFGFLLCAIIYRESLYKMIAAYMIHRVCKKIHGRWRKEKRKLFQSLNSGNLKKGEYILLEIGCGAGENFAYFPIGTSITCVDPNPHFQRYLKTSIRENKHVHVKQFIVGFAEDMRKDVASCSCDVVVATLVLCSVKDVSKVLKEILRVLKPGGKFYFIEHVAPAKKTWPYRLAVIINPLWKRLADGCETLRETKELIDCAGFSDIDYNFQKKYVFRGRVPVIFGIATK